MKIQELVAFINAAAISERRFSGCPKGITAEYWKKERETDQGTFHDQWAAISLNGEIVYNTAERVPASHKDAIATEEEMAIRLMSCLLVSTPYMKEVNDKIREGWNGQIDHSEMIMPLRPEECFPPKANEE
jgi:hypothetical protein